MLFRSVDAIVLRTFEQERLEALARAATVPVINALSDFEHPCQALADLLTVREAKGDLAGRVLTYLGDGNNVTHSLLLAGAKAGMHVRAATPPGFEPIPQIVDRARDIAAQTGGSVAVLADPIDASRGADVLYTDVWASMGQEHLLTQRLEAFAPFALDASVLAAAPADALVMHDLPAHRGEEISDEAIESPRSVVFDQAENRVHAQQAVLLLLMGRPGGQ